MVLLFVFIANNDRAKCSRLHVLLADNTTLIDPKLTKIICSREFIGGKTLEHTSDLFKMLQF